MVELMARNWWLVALRGALAVIFGILTLAWPGVTLVALILLWGIYALVDGISSIALGAAVRGHRWANVLIGVVGVLAGLVAIMLPGETAVVLLVIIAIWAIVAGVIQVAAALALRRTLKHAWFLVVTGALTLVLGIVLLLNPGAGALALVTTIAVFALIWGISLILLALRLRGLRYGTVDAV
ncbi:HdeD family acid-resistance protein [Kutzneria kofuensis]|uniref:HdeD family acid-resistance protein n=1 Tax=Kutzneria kofuensis TaxID=103725 RepID=UPI001C85C5AF|nr:HdeD family acid-resistance protein [Kutzneria kofuensis]